MKDQYICKYKCRLCGELYSSCSTQERLALKTMIEIVVAGKSEEIQAPSIIDIHFCKDGSYGLADFQGFEKGTK